MAYLDNTRANSARAYELTLCLTAKECRLLPLMNKALKSAEKRREKYLDILEGGEATTRQQDCFFDADDKVDTLKSVIAESEELIRIDGDLCTINDI